MKELDRVKSQIGAAEEASAQHAAEACRFKEQLTDMKKRYERLSSVSKADKVRRAAHITFMRSSELIRPFIGLSKRAARVRSRTTKAQKRLKPAKSFSSFCLFKACRAASDLS